MRHRGHRLLQEEDLVLDEAGGAWWIWNRRGDVVVSGKPTRAEAVIALGAGEDVAEDDDDDLATREHHATRKRTVAQLDREIAAVLAAGPAVTISVHEDADEETGEETCTISDDGGEFDDVEETSAPDVQGDIDERREHYRALGRRVVLDAPGGRGWR
jgi:hypothetical protein